MRISQPVARRHLFNVARETGRISKHITRLPNCRLVRLFILKQKIAIGSPRGSLFSGPVSSIGRGGKVYISSFHIMLKACVDHSRSGMGRSEHVLAWVSQRRQKGVWA